MEGLSGLVPVQNQTMVASNALASLADLYPKAAEPKRELVEPPSWAAPFATLHSNEKVNNQRVPFFMCADADNKDRYLILSTPITADKKANMLLMTPITSGHRHVSWRQNKKAVDAPGQDHCQFCGTPSLPGSQDRCEDHAEVVCALSDMAGNLLGFYLVDGSKTAHREIYNFGVLQVEEVAKTGNPPWAFTYVVYLQTISGSNGYTWGSYRILRADDQPATGVFSRDRNGDVPTYRQVNTPPALYESIENRLMTADMKTALFLQGKTSELSSGTLRDMLKVRNAGGSISTPTPVAKQPAFAPAPAMEIKQAVVAAPAKEIQQAVDEPPFTADQPKAPAAPASNPALDAFLGNVK